MTKKTNKKEEFYFNLFHGVVKNIPSVDEAFKRKRELKKIYEQITKPKIKQTQIEKSFTKDKTKFELNGTSFGKGRFAVAVIKEYVKQNKPNLEQLKKIFPDELLMINPKSFGLIREISKVKYQNRYFMDDIITTSDNKKVVVCSQFGIKNIMPIFKTAKKLDFQVNIIKHKK